MSFPNISKQKVLEFCNNHWIAISVCNILPLLYLTNPLFATLVVISVGLHEIGHYAVQRINGYNPDVYVFPLIGAGVSEEYNERSSNVMKRDLFIAGPTLSFLCVSVSLIVGLILSNNILIAFSFVFSINGIVNIIPVSKVDGGRLRGTIQQLYQSRKSQAYLSVYMHTSIFIGYVIVQYILLTTYNSELFITVVRGINGI